MEKPIKAEINIASLIENLVVESKNGKNEAEEVAGKFVGLLISLIDGKLSKVKQNPSVQINLHQLVGKSELITLPYDNKSLLKLRLGKSWWHLSVEEREKIELDFETVLKQVETMLQNHKSA